VRDGKWKYIHIPYVRMEQLFDLSVDPGEQDDLLATASPSPEILAQRARLQRLLQEWVQKADPLPSAFDPSQNEEIMQRLKDMGYAGGR
jgi:hypothetical protein